MLHTRHVDLAMLWPVRLWRVEWRRGWGAKRFGFQLGPLACAVWR